MPDTCQSVSGADVFLSDVSDKDKPWDTHRTNASVVSQLYQEAGISDRALRMQECANLLGFALEALETGDVRFRLRSAGFCRQRLCPVCQWRRSLMWRARFITTLPAVFEAYPSHRWILLTLTVRNCALSDLRETVQGMSKAFNCLAKYKEFPGVGWVRSLEVTRNTDTDEAHPHFHVLMMVKPRYFSGGEYVKQQRWRELWQRAMKVEYLPVVNVKVVKCDASKPDPLQGMIGAVLEVVKYSVKESDLIADASWLSDLTEQLHKIRAIAPGGVLREFLRADDPEDLIHTDDDHPSEEILSQYPEVYFGWRERLKRYQQADIVQEKREKLKRYQQSQKAD